MKYSIILILLLIGCERKEDYMQVKKEFCKSRYTGKTRENSYVYYQCYSYDSKGMCTVNMPITQYSTMREVVTDCSFADWQ